MSEPLDGMDAMVLDLGSCADLKTCKQKRGQPSLQGGLSAAPTHPGPDLYPHMSLNALNVIFPSDL